MLSLSDDAVEPARALVSCEGRARYTRGQLFYELLRAGAVQGAGDPRGCRAEFRNQLDIWESRHGRLAGLIRPEELASDADSSAMHPDVLEYAVPRALVFQDWENLFVFRVEWLSSAPRGGIGCTPVASTCLQLVA